MIDTHSHIQFKVFDENRDEVIERAKKAGVTKIIAVGTDLISSREAIEVSKTYPQVFASVGIHPHHVFSYQLPVNNYQLDLKKLEKLISNPKVVAIGETGMDQYIYTKTKYSGYTISERLIKLQKEFFQKQIQLAIKYNKALIIHNRESVQETLEVLEKNWDKKLEGHSVFHFCEPDIRLLDFAKTHKIFIGVDGDITYYEKKQEFIKKVPLELLVLETDSPFLTPEGLDSPNVPENLETVLKFVSDLLKVNKEKLEKIAYKNSLSLFNF